MYRQFRQVLVLLPFVATLATCCGGDDNPAQPVPYADLVIQTVFFTPAQPTVGQAVTAHATVRNAGAAVAAVTRTRVKVDGATICAEIQTGTLAAGDSVEVTCLVGAYSVGTHPIEVCADVTSLVTESNEQNNCTASSLVVSAEVSPAEPDLVVQAVTFDPASPTAGQSGTATARVRN